MRRLVKISAAAVLATLLFSPAKAAFVGAPMNLGLQLQRIRFETPTLAPMAYTRFCLQYPQECRQTTATMFRGGRIKMTAERHQELIKVNAHVNSAIRPEHNELGLAGERWLVAAESGDCNDYAVTKRHELIARGWPARSLLLAEVITTWGEHHLVVVVRASTGDMVIDNLNANIRPWTRTGYRWVRIQTPQNPMYWAKVGDRTV